METHWGFAATKERKKLPRTPRPRWRKLRSTDSPVSESIFVADSEGGCLDTLKKEFTRGG